MHDVLQKICAELDALVAQLNSSIPNDEPLGLAQNNWSFPTTSRRELVAEVAAVAQVLKDQGAADLGANEELIRDYPRRLQFLRTHTVPQIWGNAALAVPNFLVTIGALRAAVSTALHVDSKAEATSTLKRVTAQLRAMEARLRELDPRAASVADMVKRIELAYEAADQLPADLEALAEARQSVASLVSEAQLDKASLQASAATANELVASLKNSEQEARAVLARCESAYSAATSQGLAAAFAERSRSLNRSMWTWVMGLMIALSVGGYFGSSQLAELVNQTKQPDASAGALIATALLALLSVGGPVWFAWLATKQVGQRFRLAEDYAFKASVSRAYEGYRREAARVDADLELELLRSALARFDELPLRLVDPVSHGSPWHELLASDTVKNAVKSVPGFADRVATLAEEALRTATKAKPPATATPIDS